MVLNMISTGVMLALGKTYRNLMVDMRPTNRKMRARAVRIVMLACDIPQDKAEDLLKSSNGSLKVVISINILEVSTTDEANRQLDAVEGVLGRV